MSHEPARVVFPDGTEWHAEFNSSVMDYCIGCLPQLYPTAEARDAEWHWTWEARSVPHVCTNACTLERTEYHVLDMIFDDVMVCREHRWYYLIDFSAQGGSDGYVHTAIRYAYPPYTDAPALAGALWRACAAALDEALILHAHTTRYTLDYRAGVSSVPMCLHCKGSGTLTRTITHTTGKGKNRETTTEMRDEKCSPCDGAGKRGHMPFFGPDFDAFCAQRSEPPIPKTPDPNNPGT